MPVISIPAHKNKACLSAYRGKCLLGFANTCHHISFLHYIPLMKMYDFYFPFTIGFDFLIRRVGFQVGNALQLIHTRYILPTGLPHVTIQ